MTWIRRLRLFSRRTSFSNNLEYLGEDFLKRVAGAARKESWGRTIVQLAWTAGPVTYLALQGGYHLGYGTNAPSNLFIYFAMYTIIAGAAAILVRFVYQMTRGQDLEKGENALRGSLVRLPELIFYARNEALHYYDQENRKLLAAMHLLENPDAFNESIEAAILDVSDDPALALAAQRIEIYRKNGLYARIEDERSAVADRLTKLIEKVSPSSPAVADLIERRFHGRPPDRQTGRPRTEGFIWRVLSAGEEHDFDMMSLADAEEIFTLAYEMLAGRDIPVFSLRYIGSKNFTEASEQLDRHRLAFRKAAYLRNNKLRAMAELFVDSNPVDIVPAATPVLSTVDRMYRNILQAIEELYRELKKQTGNIPFQRRKKYSSKELHDKLLQLSTALALHRSLRAANLQMQKRYTALRRSEAKYQEIKSNAAKKFPLHLLTPGEKSRGIRIVEKHIELSKSEKLRFAKEVHKLLGTFGENRTPHMNDYKKLAIDIAMRLEQDLQISRFEIQYAVESSNAPYLASVELDMSATAKAGMAVSLVREVQKNVRTPIHRLAHVLVNYHGMPLSEKSIDFLVEKYEADPARLQQLLPEPSAVPVAGDTLEQTETNSVGKTPPRQAQILEIHRLDKKYQELLDYAVRRNLA